MDLARRSLRIRGVVQGVGFRPAVYRLADELGLGGFVCNDREGVWIEIEGARAALDRFVVELDRSAPPASRIDRIEAGELALRHERGFRIAESPLARDLPVSADLPVDLAPCDACLRELAHPSDRRFRYPFINCTACGPRFTIVRELPYDRARTTMAAFTMCGACAREYGDPRDRRFHAEPNACPVCGPRVELVVGGRASLFGDDAVRAAASLLGGGGIVAVKGAGGFVLACDADNPVAIARLRTRKRRPHKPLAVMGRTLADLEAIAVLDDAARALVRAPVRPIVLAPARTGALPFGVAGSLSDVGVYLAPTPLQHLLLHDGPPRQVMTSGNVADEPIARTNDEALATLTELADAVLLHDRDIRSRADDSVLRTGPYRAIPIRRARGLVPDSFALPVASDRALIAVGAQERSTVCLVHGRRALLSQHIGDLDHPAADTFFRETIAHLQQLADATLEAVAHDLHPDYRSTRWACHSGLPCLAIAHHHAHVAACLAEHGRDDRVVGVAFDGTGLGTDGTLWGGELLEADLGTARRRGHLRALALIGGEAAIRAPWRIAAAALMDAGEQLDTLTFVSARERARVAEVLTAADATANALCPRATSAGRWFDAVAALLGVATDVSYDGQAPAQLEAIAAPGPHTAFELAIANDGDMFELDLRPTIRELVYELARGTRVPVLAARFHATLAHAIVLGAARTGARVVALTGGCFQNRLLVRLARRGLEREGCEVLVHERVPSNDGGLALGQAAIASYRLARRTTPCA